MCLTFRLLNPYLSEVGYFNIELLYINNLGNFYSDASLMKDEDNKLSYVKYLI